MKELIDARKAIVKELQRALNEYKEAETDSVLSVYVDDCGVCYYSKAKKEKKDRLYDEIEEISERLYKFDKENPGVEEEHRRQLEIKK